MHFPLTSFFIIVAITKKKFANINLILVSVKNLRISY